MIALLFLLIRNVSVKRLKGSKGLKNMNKRWVFFLFIKILLKKITRLIDITGHDLLDIDTIHLFTPNFKLYSV